MSIFKGKRPISVRQAIFVAFLFTPMYDLQCVPKKKATIRFDSHSAQSYQNSFIFSDIEDIHQEFLLVKFEDH